MRIIKQKKRASKLGTVLTAYNTDLPISSEAQVRSMESLGGFASRMVVSSAGSPIARDGVRFVKTGKTQSIKNLLATYIQEFRGNEAILLTNPDVVGVPGIEELFKHLDAMRSEMTWACHLNLDSIPRVFIMSANVVNYLIGEIPDTMLFTNDWQAWLHLWMQRSLRQRYFDGTQFGIVTQIKDEVVVSLPVLVALPETKPEPVVKKIKLFQRLTS